LRGHKWRTAATLVVALFVIFQVCRSFILPLERNVRHAFHQAVINRFAAAARDLADRQGITLFDPTPMAAEDVIQDRVILVHGLDDPGIIWDDLAPVLAQNRFRVYIMSYPNDQAIDLSSRFFFEQMQALARILAGKKTDSVSIVAHSMGGLVARDMLTCPDLDYPGAAAAGNVPVVSRLILVGTPNHGTHMARFRMVTEIKDQIYHWFMPDTHWLHWFLDGTGAAGVDLLPGSEFLTRLNRRPLPEAVQIQVIAGMIFPGSATSSKKNMLGDGLVSVNSARLDGVPLIRVPGNHFTMIRNLIRSSTRIPPAVPVILDLMKAGR
jgi:pimeloyl-ACP methyl ester carboxylesterase